MPGPTDTDFFARADLLDTAAGSRMTKLHGLATRMLPDRAKASAQRRMTEPQRR
jgi:hypothetical protein